MKLEFCDSNINFGDGLNNWLWPKLINFDLSRSKDSVFIGIGSILGKKLVNDLEGNNNVAVFSTGSFCNNNVALNPNWKIYGVRGPRTAKIAGLNKDKVIGDGAYLIRNFFPESKGDGDKIGFIPHVSSEMYIDWEKICRDVGFKFISPKQSTENFISDLYECKQVISEAMHGAIAADALRIPWKGVSFSPAFADKKWYDWAESLDIELIINKLPFFINKKVPLGRYVEDMLKYYVKIKSNRVNTYLNRVSKFNEDDLKKSLRILADKDNFQLSKDESFERVFAKLNKAVLDINNDLKMGVF